VKVGVRPASAESISPVTEELDKVAGTPLRPPLALCRTFQRRGEIKGFVCTVQGRYLADLDQYPVVTQRR